MNGTMKLEKGMESEEESVAILTPRREKINPYKIPRVDHVSGVREDIQLYHSVSPNSSNHFVVCTCPKSSRLL